MSKRKRHRHSYIPLSTFPVLAMADMEDDDPHTGHILSSESAFSDLSLEGGVIIDHESNDNNFVNVEGGYANAQFSEDEASLTLARCKKYIVSPYNFLLKVVGWRAIQTRRDTCHTLIKIFNVVYPVFVFTMILITCIAQVTSCFHRTRSIAPNRTGEDFYVTSCEARLVTFDIISYLMMLVAYLLALYTFRVSEPEHLSTLVESVFLSFSSVTRLKSRTPFVVLLIIFSLGIGFFFTSTAISITRLFALGLERENIVIGWFTSDETAPNQLDYLKINKSAYDGIHYLLVVLAYFGFMFFDLLFIAVTINYCSQCQLLTFYIDNIQDKVRNKKYDNLHIAIKEINRIYEFLKILNGKVAIVASLIFFIFVSNVMLSYNDFIKPNQSPINIVTGFLNTAQWLVASLFPVLLAARLTSSGNELRRLGQEIAARPFYYADTPDLELQFFLTFTESTRYQAHLAFIPMQPSIVLGFSFIALLFISSGVVISQVESITWF